MHMKQNTWVNCRWNQQSCHSDRTLSQTRESLVELPPSWSRGNNSFRPCGRVPRPVTFPNTNKQNSRISTTDRPRMKKCFGTSSARRRRRERIVGWIGFFVGFLSSFVALSRTRNSVTSNIMLPYIVDFVEIVFTTHRQHYCFQTKQGLFHNRSHGLMH